MNVEEDLKKEIMEAYVQAGAHIVILTPVYVQVAMEVNVFLCLLLGKDRDILEHVSLIIRIRVLNQSFSV